MTKQEEIRKSFELSVAEYAFDTPYEKLSSYQKNSVRNWVTLRLATLRSQGVVIKVKCPDCEWSQFVDEESVGMTPCLSCNSIGYLIEPLIEEIKA